MTSRSEVQCQVQQCSLLRRDVRHVMIDDVSLPQPNEISHVSCQKALRMTLHLTGSVNDLVWNTGLFAVESYHEVGVNAFGIVHHDGGRPRSAVIGVHCAYHNAEVNELSEEVTFPCKRLHGSYQTVVQIADVPVPSVVVRLEMKHHEALVILSRNGHHDKHQRLAENAVDLRAVLLVACRRTVA